MLTRIDSKKVQGVAFALVLCFLFILRFFLLAAYPFGFGHPDSGQYTEPIIRYLNEGVFAPHPLRVMGTYAVFLIAIIKSIGASTFTIVLVQHAIGILIACLAGALVAELTRSRWFAILTVFLVGILPRGLLYEHIVLAENLYVFLSLLYVYLTIHYVKKPTWKKEIILGVMASALVLCRGQGIIAIVLSLGFITYVHLKVTKQQVLILRGVTFFMLPLLLFSGMYTYANMKYNDYPGLSANGSYNLFFTSTANLTDFNSPHYRETKDLLKECVAATNEKFQGVSNWALTEEICRAPQAAIMGKYGHPENWRLLDKEFSELAREAILAHPMAYLYRVVWNIAEFFYGRRDMLSTVDLHVLLLKWGVLPLEIDPAKTEHVRGMGLVDVFGGVPHGLDSLRSSFSQSNSAMYSAYVSYFINAFSFLENCRQFLAGTLLLCILCLLFSFKERAAGFVLVGFVLLHGIMTAMPVNSLYERYYIPIEPLQIISWSLVFSTLKEITGKERVAYLKGVFLLWAVAWTSWKLLVKLPAHWMPVVDSAILNMSKLNQQLMSRFVLSSVISTVLVCLIARVYYGKNLHEKATES